MKSNIKLFILALLCPSVLWAQENDSIPTLMDAKKNVIVEYKNGISYGMQEATTALSVIGSDELSHKTAVNASNLLYGLLPGLQVLQNPGNAWNDGASLLIRGVGTLSASSPLILVDGFERSLDYLSSDEIESITVLKDAVSTSLYGVKGANGVILVKTKRGKDAAPEIGFSYQFNMGTPQRLPEFVDAYTYGQALNEALMNEDAEPRYRAEELQAFKDGKYPDFYPNVDWWNESIRDHSYGDNVTFYARGGGKMVKYFSQLNFLDDRGILKPTNLHEGYSTQFKYSKMNVRTNLDLQLSKTTQVKLNMFGNFAEHNRPGSEKIFDYLYKVPAAAFPVKTKHGINGGSTIYADQNPVANIAETGYARSQSRALFADLEISQKLDFVLDGLSVGARVGLDNYATYWDNNTKEFGYESAKIDLASGTESYETLRNEGNLKFSSSVGASSNHFNLEAYTNYAHTWGEHNLNTTLLYSMDKDTQKDQNATTAFMNVMFQTHYMYKNKYLLDFSIGGSASSVLEPGNRWGVFPSIGLGWILSEESFMKKDWLNLLKMRASYGIVGRADYGANLFESYYSSLGNAYYFKDNLTGETGMRENRLGVVGFTYEKSHKTNVGLDFMAFDRLAVTLDGYYDHRTDILVDATGSVSTVLGITAPQQNSGVVDSYGVDAAVSWNDRIGQVKYNLGAMFSYAANEIKEMNEQYRPYDYLKRTGHSVNQIFGYEVEGIYQSQEDIDNREVKQYLSTVYPGDLKFKDQNGDKRIDEFDQVALGYNTVTPEFYYSFDLGVEYKGVGLYALFQGTGNYSEILDVASVYRPLVSDNTISTHYYENRWTKDNPNALYPRLTYAGSSNNYNTNSVWVADASYLKLRTLELYYKLSSSQLKSVGFLKNVKIFARTHDLFTWDKIDVMDPEAIGVSHPLMTQYTFGVNLTF